MKRLHFIFFFSLITAISHAQLRWQNVDSLYQPLPKGIHVYKTTDSIDGKPNIAFYVSADLNNKKLEFKADTSHQRRLTPKEFYQKNNQPLVVVNTTFFSFETNQNLNTVIVDGRIVSHNKPVAGRGKDTLLYHHSLNSVLGISKKRKADIAWVYTDSMNPKAFALQMPVKSIKNNQPILTRVTYSGLIGDTSYSKSKSKLTRWKMSTAVGGGPVLVQNNAIRISNNEERKFGGNAINDRHPRTAMGYTKDNILIILVVQGRFPGAAEGASLIHEASILKDLGCVEALNLDGGGSSCLLINGKETIAPSDKIQRAIPAVFIINSK